MSNAGKSPVYVARHLLRHSNLYTNSVVKRIFHPVLRVAAVWKILMSSAGFNIPKCRCQRAAEVRSHLVAVAAAVLFVLARLNGLLLCRLLEIIGPGLGRTQTSELT